jgi:hypothetical protein
MTDEEFGILALRAVIGVGVEDDRHAAGLAESAIGEADSVGPTNCVGAVWWRCWFIGIPLAVVLKLTCKTVEGRRYPAQRKLRATAPGQDQLALCPPSTLRT